MDFKEIIHIYKNKEKQLLQWSHVPVEEVANAITNYEGAE